MKTVKVLALFLVLTQLIGCSAKNESSISSTVTDGTDGTGGTDGSGGTGTSEGMGARAYRDIGSTTERLRPLVNKDHDGMNETSGSRSGLAAVGDPDNTVAFADTSAITTCGNTQTTVAARIADCNFSWDGTTLGNAGQGKWHLVTKVNSKQVWQDERTGLLWSDNLGNANWCQGAGNTENLNSIDCTAGAGSNLQPATPVSMCAEDTGFNSDGYDDAKGGMRLAASGTSPSIKWRLPTREDLMLAYVNGGPYAAPFFRDTNGYWTASVYSLNRAQAWGISANANGRVLINAATRSASYAVRCVGQ